MTILIYLYLNSYDVSCHYLTFVPHIRRGEEVKVEVVIGVVIGVVITIDLALVVMIGVATPPVATTARV